ncbi:MAG: diguanylate cyclase [Pseudomonadales bacterium]|nr:diguanylate cyclase [Pseudomonadales bacterium]
MDPKPDISLNKLLELMLDVVCIVDAEGRFISTSSASEQIFGYTQEEMAKKSVYDLVHPDDLEHTRARALQVQQGESSTQFENRYIRKDGSIVHLMWSARWSEEDNLRIAVARDISQRKQAEHLKEAVYAISEAANVANDLHALFKQIHEIIGRLMPAKNFFVALYDTPSQILSFPYYVDEKHNAPPPGRLDASTRSATIIRTSRPVLLSTVPGSESSGMGHIDVGDGARSWLGVPLKSERQVVGVLAVQSYLSTQKYSEADQELLQFVSGQIAAAIARKTMLTRLEYMAQYDQLTGLPNRELLIDRMRIALARARRDKGQVALLFIDLDKFKVVNDSMGHAAGDHLLQSVAGRLREGVRDTDTVARLGGDEFVVLLEGKLNEEDVIVFARKMRLLFDTPFILDQKAIKLSPSIGVAFYPRHGADETQLLKHADKAMYAAKKQGGNRVEIWT